MMKNKKQLFFQLEKKTLSLFQSESHSLLALDARNVQNMINARMNDNDDNDATTTTTASWLCLQMVGRLARVIAGFFFFLPEVSPLTQKRIEEELKKLHGWSASTRSLGGRFYKLSQPRLE